MKGVRRLAADNFILLGTILLCAPSSYAVNTAALSEHPVRVFVGVAANYLPWILVTRCVFLYHFFATVPFLLLSTVYLFFLLEQENRRIAWIKWAWLGLAVVYFVLLYPAISGLPTSYGYAGFLENVLPASILYYGWV